MLAVLAFWALRKLFEACCKHREGLSKFSWLEMCYCALL